MGDDLFADLCKAACCPDGHCVAEPCVAGSWGKHTLFTVLRRLRAPSEGMVKAAARLDLDPGSNVLHSYPKSVRAAVWAAMIDHLIAEGERRGV